MVRVGEEAGHAEEDQYSNDKNSPNGIGALRQVVCLIGDLKLFPLYVVAAFYRGLLRVAMWGPGHEAELPVMRHVVV